jgi:hypothetical protein
MNMNEFLELPLSQRAILNLLACGMKIISIPPGYALNEGFYLFDGEFYTTKLNPELIEVMAFNALIKSHPHHKYICWYGIA